MKVSVVMTTARYGGWDVLNDCMSKQTMPKTDFEVIVVDELYYKRQHFAYLCQFDCVHVPPSEIVPHYDNSRAFNQALRLAKGELVCFFVDYMHVDPDYLVRHWKFYDMHKYTLTGFIDRYDFPELLPEGSESGLWSMFTAPFDMAMFKDMRYAERKGMADLPDLDTYLEITGERIYLIPDSVPMEVLRQLNGLDESYDDGYGSNDIDLATRANMIGHKFYLDPKLIARKFGVPETSVNIPGVKKPKHRLDNYNQVYMPRMRQIRSVIKTPKGRGAWE